MDMGMLVVMVGAALAVLNKVGMLVANQVELVHLPLGVVLLLDLGLMTLLGGALLEEAVLAASGQVAVGVHKVVHQLGVHVFK